GELADVDNQVRLCDLCVVAVGPLLFGEQNRYAVAFERRLDREDLLAGLRVHERTEGVDGLSIVRDLQRGPQRVRTDQLSPHFREHDIASPLTAGVLAVRRRDPSAGCCLRHLSDLFAGGSMTQTSEASKTRPMSLLEALTGSRTILSTL